MACRLTTSETIRLDRTDIDLERGVATVTRTRLQPRVVPLSTLAREALEAYLDMCSPSDAGDLPLFQTEKGTRLSARSLQAAFQTRRRILGLSDELVPSDLRHMAR
jgi:integrase/recombinase XerC